jgi:hypothetical protein
MIDEHALLSRLLDASQRPARLWTYGTRARLYLTCPAGADKGAYVTVDRDGDLLFRSEQKLSRVAVARIWTPWDRAATSIGLKAYLVPTRRIDESSRCKRCE